VGPRPLGSTSSGFVRKEIVQFTYPKTLKFPPHIVIFMLSFNDSFLALRCFYVRLPDRPDTMLSLFADGTALEPNTVIPFLHRESLEKHIIYTAVVYNMENFH
jgi:hypothetical protein